ncbi:hypothetical protein F4W66_17650 [Escherichia coli]|nr:hypothetical protein F4W66_17650 [Escherichia coli]
MFELFVTWMMRFAGDGFVDALGGRTDRDLWLRSRGDERHSMRIGRTPVVPPCGTVSQRRDKSLRDGLSFMSRKDRRNRELATDLAV